MRTTTTDLDPFGEPPAGARPHAGFLPALLAGYLLAFAAVTMLNVALPAAQDDLGMSSAGRQWVVTSYSLTFGGLMLLGGRLGDVLGLRRAMALGLWGYAVASLVAGLAPDAATLVAGRAGQGAAAALVAPAGLALLSVAHPEGPARARAFAVLGIVMGVGTAGTLVLAGWLVDVASWRWALLVGGPVAGASAWGVARWAPPAPPSGTARADLPGALVVTAGVAGLVVGFDQARTGGWTGVAALAWLVAGATLAAAFGVRVARHPRALLPRHVVADPARATAFGAVLLLGIAMFAGLFLLTGHLQDAHGWSALRTGLAFLPFSAGALVASRLVRDLVGRVAPRALLTGGLLAAAAAVALLGRLTTTSGYLVDVLPIMLLLGVAGTVVMVTASDVATRGLGTDSGVAGATVGAVQQLAAALGTALLTSVAGSAPDGLARAGTVGAVLVVGGTAALLLVPVSRRRAPARGSS